MSAEATNSAASEFQRGAHIPDGYSAGWHGVRTLALATAIGALGVYLARTATAWDLLFVPLFFVAANAIEWSFHRGPMHRPMNPRIFYQNHALLHHRAFEHDHMQVDHPRELNLVMMPWYTMLILFALASPIALIGYLVRGPAVAGLFYVTAAVYFLMYETMHALYHLPQATLQKLGLGGRMFQALRAHHTYHHRLGRMAFVNFNVTWPLMDWLFGTKESEQSSARNVPAGHAKRA